MKKFADYYYDETGLCPVCGEGLVPVTVYSGKVLKTNVSTKVQDINTKVRTTTKTYTDITPLYVGYCLACAKRAHEAKQEQTAAVKPKPTFIIVWAALFTASLAGLVPMIGSGGTVDVATPGGVLSIVSVFLLIPALIGVIWSIAAFVKKNRQYAAGAREPFKAPSEEGMSSSAAYYLNKQPAPFCEYLSIEQVKRMSHTMPS